MGAELVAVMNVPPAEDDADAGGNADDEKSSNADTDTGVSPQAAGRPRSASRYFSEMPSPNVTTLIWFSLGALEQVLASHDVVLSVYDPYREDSVERHAQAVPLSATFSAGDGIWLARSGFAEQSLRMLFGRARARGIDAPRIYMMQPF
ncbi:hypothetical protein QFZ99_000791 [Paraburkholderia atlantica]|uniref:hypothetical protein n=1 Tax=Paraburkholderia atlantica TaxID=2654982 RepID=UPI003D213271